MSELILYSVAAMEGNYSCPTTVKHGAAEVPADVEPQMQCTLINSAVTAGSSNDGLWNDIWRESGACVGDR